MLIKGKSKFNAKDKDGFTPLLRCCQESPMTKDPKQESADEIKISEDKANQDQSRADTIRALVSKGKAI